MMTEIVKPDGNVIPFPEEGDWVLVWGQVAPGQTHPEDVMVRFVSHNSDYTCHIKIDRIRVPADDLLPDFVERCTHLGQTVKKGRHYLLRCTGHYGHGGDHTARDIRWPEGETVGYFEEA